MRKIIYIVCLLVAHASFAQETNVRKMINEKLDELYPERFKEEWEFEKGVYEVEFKKINGLECELIFSTEGELLKIKEELVERQLPKEVRITLRREYSDCIVDEIEKITSKSKTEYKIKLKSVYEKWKVYVDESGVIVKRYRD